MDSRRLLDVVKASDLSVANRLIESGDDVNQQDEHGWTPLNWAAGNGDLEMVRLLIEKGADAFKVGRDQRTPYKIALAAGKAEVARFLRDIEERSGRRPPDRQYAKAYRLSELRQFPAWPEGQLRLKHDHKPAPADGYAVSNDPVVFIHQDLTVTSSMWHDEEVVFDAVTPEWREFCQSVLRFKVPDDLDLIATE